LKSSRPAWVEVDLARLQKNFETFTRDKPAQLGFIAVVKDDAYGHGMVEVGKMALAFGAKYLAVATVNEALALREAGLDAPVIIFGERTVEELQLCVKYQFTCFVNDRRQATALSKLAAENGKPHPVHVEIDSGLSRYGVHWKDAIAVIEYVSQQTGLLLEGVMSHFAMSDELDKTFALRQLQRFEKALFEMTTANIHVKYKHLCNTGGFLDLPAAHFDLVRIGILPLGVYPSRVCRRIAGLQPVMSVKTRVAAIREIEPGDFVGYGLRYQADSKRRIATLPIGYGDGFPRLRNKGSVLLHGKRASIIGGNAMDAMMIDITDAPETRQWDEVVLMGRQQNEEIDANELAALKNGVSYDILAGWRQRLPRIYSNG